jgi:DNA recombination protein RmuC
MTPLLTWWPAMLAGGLALLFGWWLSSNQIST